ncbi:HlyD family efflux transporter periplasmic adaptor subunit, partial [Chloroflexota bacterium]
EVLVEEGDTVEEGQVLASLDEEEWEDNLTVLRDRLTAAERALTTKVRALASAERQVIDAERDVAVEESDVTEAEHQVTTKELAVRQAAVNLQEAEYNLSEIDEVKEAQDDVEEAEDNLAFIKKVLAGEVGGGFSIPDIQYWWQLEDDAEEDLEDAQEELEEVLAGTSTTITSSDDAEQIMLEISRKQLLVEQKQLALKDAQIDVEDAKQAVEDAKYILEEAQIDAEDAKRDVADAQLDLEDASKALLDAQEDLEEANSKSPLIVAPFDGFITTVNVEGGDEVLKGTVAVQIADPNKFEAEIMVSEMDISQVKEGGDARVQVDAMLGLTLPAKVTHISPTATIQSGVVNYKVKVEVASLEEMIQERQAARQATPRGGQQTQEGQQGQLATTAPESFQLREGLTVTVTILVQQSNNVLLVPNSAITRRGGQNYVNVVVADDMTEECAIGTGLSDWQYTEVTEGLNEGEQIIVPQGTTTTTTTTQSQQSSGGAFIHGVGRIR